MAKSDLDAPQREPRPEWGYWDNRASFHTEAEREARLQSYLETSAPYFAAVEANGGKPWFGSIEERRGLYMRRHTRPEPPASVPARTLAEIRGEHTNDEPPQQHQPEAERSQDAHPTDCRRSA